MQEAELPVSSVERVSLSDRKVVLDVARFRIRWPGVELTPSTRVDAGLSADVMTPCQRALVKADECRAPFDGTSMHLDVLGVDVQGSRAAAVAAPWSVRITPSKNYVEG